MWGLNESVKKGRITFNTWDWDNPLGQVWTCLGPLGLAINMRPYYPHFIISWLHRDSVLWWFNSCNERASTRYDLTPRRWYGTSIKARVHLDPFARRWSGGSTPFFLSIIYPYHMLTLDHHSNSWYHSHVSNVSFVGFCFLLDGWWSIDVRSTLI